VCTLDNEGKPVYNLAMTSKEVREKYLQFFEKRGHARIASSPLVLENDPTTLFTSSGMQQLVPYLKGQKYLDKGGKELKRLVDSQPSIRAQGKNDDMFEVGDNRHLTFFEMLGNWSLGDYFKKEQLPWFYEFLTSKDEGLGLNPARLYVSVFEGSREVPKDDESIEIWRDLFRTNEPAGSLLAGFSPKVKIYSYPAKKNWWSRSGTPEEMPAGEIGGPDSEVFYDFDPESKLHIHEKSKFKDSPCHPNCDCGRFTEIGNSVFIQYIKQDDGSLKELPQKNVDFGGGFERLTAAVSGKMDTFQTELFSGLISIIENSLGKRYLGSENMPTFQVIADHLKASTMLVVNGVTPSNKEQGYVLRKLLRRAAVKTYLLGGGLKPVETFVKLGQESLAIYDGVYTNKKKQSSLVDQIITDELTRFSGTLDRGLKVIQKTERFDGKVAFDLYQSYGFPVELTIELLQQKGRTIDVDGFRKAFSEHREKSRTASIGMFLGGVADHGEQVTKLHTATHLLHAALRKILGEHVAQKGSNITAERLRFDFSHPQKLTDEEIKKVEDLVNEQIKKDLSVTYGTMTLDEAIKSGALHFFAEKYGDQVKVYTVGDPKGNYFSKEVCGGPHVTHTGGIGHVTIIKQEKIGAGLIRIYATNKSEIRNHPSL
jgi:alanyl-tRNA synthetase